MLKLETMKNFSFNSRSLTVKLVVMLSIFIMVFASCQDETITISAPDYLVFGHYYGECIGEQCVEIFRLEQDKLYEDKMDAYPYSNGFYIGSYILLSQEKFNKVKDLTGFFPADLLTEQDTVIGQPDAGDWGGLYIEYNIDGVRKFWLIDQMKSNVPAKYHEFIDKVNEKISLLQ
jgi:hypothetical protein